jgi:hypothetical protein
MSKEVYTFTKALTIAFTAQRFNDKYIKETAVPYTIDGKLLGDPIVANKQIMRFLVQDHSGMDPNVIDFLNKNEKKLRISEDDENDTTETIEWLEGLAMRAMATDLNGFESKLYATFEKDDISTYDFGMIASIPQTSQRVVKKETLEDMIMKTCTGNWVGKVGDKVSFTANLISGVYSRNYSSYIYVAISDDKLITFWSQKDFLEEVGKNVKIWAKVKRTDMSRWYNGIKETQLNYVKIN